ncbi:MAG: MBL fold metallo-hydrolase [Cellulophaga sp.]
MKKQILFFVCLIVLFGCKEKVKSEKNTRVEKVKPTFQELKNELIITAIEHATAILEWKDITIYIDPVGDLTYYEKQKSPNIILITDIHGDHLSVKTLEALDLSNTKIIAPQAVIDKLPENIALSATVLSNGNSITIATVGIEAIPMYNLREEALKFHNKGRGNGYIISINSERIYFSGDTEDIPEMRALKNIDRAFICMNLPYTMTESSAASAVLEFKPKLVYPYHYRGRPTISDVTLFKKLVNEGNSSIEVIQLDWYPKEAY